MTNREEREAACLHADKIEILNMGVVKLINQSETIIVYSLFSFIAFKIP